MNANIIVSPHSVDTSAHQLYLTHLKIVMIFGFINLMYPYISSHLKPAPLLYVSYKILNIRHSTAWWGIHMTTRVVHYFKVHLGDNCITTKREQ